jgi:hypothetical protein
MSWFWVLEFYGGLSIVLLGLLRFLVYEILSCGLRVELQGIFYRRRN